MGPQSYVAMGPFAYGKPAPGPFSARQRDGILWTVKDKSKGWAEDPQKEKGEIMKKVLMVVFVLSLLGLLAVPVLAEILVEEGGPYNEVVPAPGPGIRRKAGLENPVQIARGGCRLPVEPPFYAPQSMAWAG